MRTVTDRLLHPNAGLSCQPSFSIAPHSQAGRRADEGRSRLQILHAQVQRSLLDGARGDARDATAFQRPARGVVQGLAGPDQPASRRYAILRGARPRARPGAPRSRPRHAPEAMLRARVSPASAPTDPLPSPS
ncbi:hypothetical protein VPH35_061881 [Triticum aestivum]